MPRSDALDGSLINSIVGEGTHFRGHLDLSGLLRIDGDFSGSIKTSGRVIIGSQGRADCTINAATVVVGGVLRGNVYASEQVILLDRAIVLGNIYSPRLTADEDTIIDGSLLISGRNTLIEPSEEIETRRRREPPSFARKVRRPGATRRSAAAQRTDE